MKIRTGKTLIGKAPGEKRAGTVEVVDDAGRVRFTFFYKIGNLLSRRAAKRDAEKFIKDAEKGPKR